MSEPKLRGLVPETLRVRSQRIVLESLEVQTDIGFHEFEVGAPQRLVVTVELWLEDATAPLDDDPAHAWNYDFLRAEVQEIASSRRFNLQETLANAVFERLAAFRGVRALRCKPRSQTFIRTLTASASKSPHSMGIWPDK